MRRVVAMLAFISIAASIAACGGPAPFSATHDVLGRPGSVTLYPAGANAAVAAASAFERMQAAKRSLNAADPGSAIAAVNAAPREPHRLPLEAVMVFTVADAWGVGSVPATGAAHPPRTPGEYSPTTGGVAALYPADPAATPPRDRLAAALAASRWWVRNGEDFRFLRVRNTTGTAVPAGPPAALDFEGVDDGVALDFALQQLGGVDGGLMTLGSTALAFGRTPEGAPWKVGIEDPGRPGTAIAVIVAEPRGPGPSAPPPVPELTASTSGGSARVIDPATGEPASGLRMLTVFGRMNALDAAILSRALLVMGPERALAYARAHGIGVLAVGRDGRRTVYLPPSLPGFRVEDSKP